MRFAESAADDLGGGLQPVIDGLKPEIDTRGGAPEKSIFPAVVRLIEIRVPLFGRDGRAILKGVIPGRGVRLVQLACHPDAEDQ